MTDDSAGDGKSGISAARTLDHGYVVLGEMSNVLHHPGRYDVDVYVGHSEFVVKHNDVLVSVAPRGAGVRLTAPVNRVALSMPFTKGCVPVANPRAYVLALHEVQEHVRGHLGCVPVGARRRTPIGVSFPRSWIWLELGWAGAQTYHGERTNAQPVQEATAGWLGFSHTGQIRR